MSTRSWDDILDEDEAILWQGRPDPKARVRLPSLALVVFGVAFAGFALYETLGAVLEGRFAWRYALIDLPIGLAVIYGALLDTPLKYRRTWYSLSNKRAFIATDFPLGGRHLASFPIDRDTSLTLEQGKRDNLFFATEEYRVRGRKRTRRIGFESLADGTQVYHLMRDLQRLPGPEAPR